MPSFKLHLPPPPHLQFAPHIFLWRKPISYSAFGFQATEHVVDALEHPSALHPVIGFGVAEAEFRG